MKRKCQQRNVKYSLELLRRSKREVEVVLGVHVELDRFVSGLEPRAIDLEVDWAVVRLLDDVQLHTKRFRHRSGSADVVRQLTTAVRVGTRRGVSSHRRASEVVGCIGFYRVQQYTNPSQRRY